jgi:hypothetical protein
MAILVPSSRTTLTAIGVTVAAASVSLKSTLIAVFTGTVVELSWTVELTTVGGTISATNSDRFEALVLEFPAASWAMQDIVSWALGAAFARTWKPKFCETAVWAGLTVNSWFPVAAPVAAHETDVTPMLSIAVNATVPAWPGLYNVAGFWPGLDNVTTGRILS